MQLFITYVIDVAIWIFLRPGVGNMREFEYVNSCNKFSNSLTLPPSTTMELTSEQKYV